LEPLSGTVKLDQKWFLKPVGSWGSLVGNLRFGTLLEPLSGTVKLDQKWFLKLVGSYFLVK
jgi:hypothetical protein